MKRYTFDLDADGSDRWVNILNDFIPMRSEIRNFIRSLFVEYDIGLSVLSLLADNMKKNNKILYVKEIEYIANYFEVSFIEILLLQLIYETSAACSVGMLKINNKDFYFRTLDWRMGFLRNITIFLDIVKNGETIGTAVTWVGYIGFATCNVKNQYNVALNYRLTKPMNLTTLCENIYKTINLQWPITYLIRAILENELSYDDAISNFTNNILISPCYISIYSKIHKSVIITRDPDSLVSIRDHDLVQTNCDFDKNIPNISQSVERRNLIYDVEKICNTYNITSYDEIIKMLLEYPVLNENTIYYVSEYENIKRVVVLN